ncbi:MAG: hypothetical protein JNK05_31025 [Myxococcales bacterium]|nr:hypothetical protein [Myxococcales bacterium]
MPMRTRRWETFCAFTSTLALSACAQRVAPAVTPDASAMDVFADTAHDAPVETATDATIDRTEDTVQPDATLCPVGAVLCGDRCVAENGGDTEACGARCARCADPPNGAALCNAGSCDFRCNVGYVRQRDACVPSPPALISPLSSWTINEANPEFRISTHRDFVRYDVELCRDRTCAQSIARWTTNGAPSRPSAAPPPNTQLYWRATGVTADGHRSASNTAPFRTTRRSARGTDSVIFDFDGDGFADTATIGSLRHSLSSDIERPAVLFGSATLSSVAQRSLALDVAPGASQATVGALQFIGDFDGDGRSDVVAVGTHVQVFFGAARTERRTSFEDDYAPNLGSHPIPYKQNLHAVAALGDVNDDGLSDFAVAEWFPPDRTQAIRVYLGNRDGRVRAAYVHQGSEAHQLVRADCPGSTAPGRAIVTLSRNPLETRFVVRAFRVTATSIERLPGEAMVPFSLAALEQLGDIDGDGGSEAVVRSIAPTNTAMIVRVCGAQLSTQTITLPSNVIAFARTTDLDGDGTQELIVAREAHPEDNEFIVAFRGGANVLTSRIGSFRLTMPMPLGSRDFFTQWIDRGFGSPGDMNGDGLDDFATGTIILRYPASVAPILFFTGGDLDTWPRAPTELLGTTPLFGHFVG